MLDAHRPFVAGLSLEISEFTYTSAALIDAARPATFSAKWRWSYTSSRARAELG